MELLLQAGLCAFLHDKAAGHQTCDTTSCTVAVSSGKHRDDAISANHGMSQRCCWMLELPRSLLDAAQSHDGNHLTRYLRYDENMQMSCRGLLLTRGSHERQRRERILCTLTAAAPLALLSKTRRLQC